MKVAALSGGVGTLDHHGRSAHTENQAVATAIERQRCLLHDIVCGGRAG